MDMIYIGYYVTSSSKVKRSYVPSAVNKIRYMLKSFSKAYDHIDIFSASRNLETAHRIFRAEAVHDGNICIRHPFSWGGKGKIHSFIMRWWTKITVFVYLLIYASRDEHVYVYHSTGYGRSILLAKTLKKFKLILEVEEIYSEVENSSRLRKSEERYFQSADAFIFATELLNNVVNKKEKPYIVINGTYEVEERLVDKIEDGKIHVVYAGIFDVRKGGAAAAAAAAKFLDDNYVMHICGFGTKSDEESLKSFIRKSNETNSCKIKFHGLLTGREYIVLLQQCHIGLSSQNPDADFNATSFPSKILSYLANGLVVVSIKIPAIVQSNIGCCLSYYEKQTPEEIAKAIKNAPLDKDFRGFISNLSDKFDMDVVYLKNSI